MEKPTIDIYKDLEKQELLDEIDRLRRTIVFQANECARLDFNERDASKELLMSRERIMALEQESYELMQQSKRDSELRAEIEAVARRVRTKMGRPPPLDRAPWDPVKEVAEYADYLSNRVDQLEADVSELSDEIISKSRREMPPERERRFKKSKTDAHVEDGPK